MEHYAELGKSPSVEAALKFDSFLTLDKAHNYTKTEQRGALQLCFPTLNDGLMFLQVSYNHQYIQ